MAPFFPTEFELKCSGCSLIISQMLLGVAWLMHSIDYDAYDVQNEEQVLELHSILSSSDHRTEVEIGVSCVWIAFPFLLIALFGIKKFAASIFYNTSAEMVIYVFEKAYIIYVTAATIILPALSLVSVSYEWSFHEYTPEPDFVPTGYYIQLYALTLELELIDCMSIADATFMIGLFLLPRFILLGSTPTGNPRFKKFRLIMEPQWIQRRHVLSKCCFEIMGSCIVASLFIMFCLVLFEFAESGFFSLTGYAKFLVGWSFILKFILGIRLYVLGASNKYKELKKVFGNSEDDDAQHIMGGHDQNYQMDTVDVDTAAGHLTNKTPDALNDEDDDED